MSSQKAFKFDRTAFSCGSIEEASIRSEGKELSISERVIISRRLTYRAMGFDPDHPPRLDRTAFSCGKVGD